jgi:hypothetical protein
MAFSVFGLDIRWIILIIIVILVISFILFRRYFSALVYDYVVDCGLSFLDEPFGGIVMLDWGDWIAAILIFIKEKKITGRLIALIVALEAANFIPVLDWITNLFPAVTISRLLFNKYKSAEKKEKILEKDISLAERLGINVRRAKKVSKEVKQKIKKANPVGALKELNSKKTDDKLRSELRDYTNNWISATNNIIQGIYDQNIQAPQEIINILEQGIAQAQKSLGDAQSALKTKPKENFETAINSAVNAYNTIMAAVQQFDDLFQQYQNELQQQEQLQQSYAR